MQNGLFINGIRVIESKLAITREPVKPHVKRRTQSERYHRRIQKKWTRRFGEKMAPSAFAISGGTILAHPEIIAAMKKEPQ